jgi:UDP-glucose 4-epimerase
MKRILITGAGSYIGTTFEKYITENYSGDYAVDTVDMIDG